MQMDVPNHSNLHQAHCDMVPFRVLYAIMPSLQSSWLLHCTLLFVQPFALRACALSCCKHDIDPILWLNVKTLKRAPTPFVTKW